MPQAETDEEYLSAFMSGLEFALLAVEGRLPDGPEREAFLADYRRVLGAYRGRAPPSPAAIRVLGPVLRAADLDATARN